MIILRDHLTKMAYQPMHIEVFPTWRQMLTRLLDLACVLVELVVRMWEVILELFLLILAAVKKTLLPPRRDVLTSRTNNVDGQRLSMKNCPSTHKHFLARALART